MSFKTLARPVMMSETGTGFSAEVPRRAPNIPGFSPRPADADPEGARLVVAAGITLNGEISKCDRLIVEGTVKAEVKDCRILEVAEGGTYEGAAMIESAEISGTFIGDLTVRGLLTLRPTGLVKGNVQAGILEVQKGGKISGKVEPLES